MKLLICTPIVRRDRQTNRQTDTRPMLCSVRVTNDTMCLPGVVTLGAAYDEGEASPVGADGRSLGMVRTLGWFACWTQAQKGLGSNRSRDSVG